MNLAELSDDELRKFKTETARRIAAIANAEGHQYIAYSQKDGWATLLDLDTGKEVYGKGDA